MQNKILEEYADKIHERWLNARVMMLSSVEERREYWKGVMESYAFVENDIRKMLKEDEDLIKKEN